MFAQFGILSAYLILKIIINTILSFQSLICLWIKERVMSRTQEVNLNTKNPWN